MGHHHHELRDWADAAWLFALALSGLGMVYFDLTVGFDTLVYLNPSEH
jgi:hypothetical protein